jgi:hypothetical protein
VGPNCIITVKAKPDELSNTYLASTRSSDGEDEANVFPDNDWFLLDATRTPTADDLKTLKQIVRDTDVLKATTPSEKVEREC